MPRPLPTTTYARLVEELDAGRIDGPVLSAACAAGDPYALLFRAGAHAAGGRFRRARADVAEARRTGDALGVVHLVGGMILYVCRDHEASLRAFDTATERNPNAATRAYRERIRRAARLEWAHEVRESIAEAIRIEPRNLTWHLEAVRNEANARNWEAALAHADATLQVEPRAQHVHMERATILATLGRGDEALKAAAKAIELTPDREYRMEAARVALDVGDYAVAEDYYRQAAKVFPDIVDSKIGLATLRLFAMKLDEARALVDEALATVPSDAGALRTRGAIAVLEGRFEAALPDLDAALAADDGDYRAHVWRAEALLRLGRWDECFDALHRSTMCADGYLLAAWVLRLLGLVLSGDPHAATGGHGIEEVRAAVIELVPQGRDDMFSEDPDRVAAVLEEALRRLGGNRTTMPSRVADGVPIRVPVDTAPRYGSRRALELVRTVSAEIALRELDRMVERFGDSSLPICHRGELRLWMGDLEGARKDLEKAIAIHPQTRWAWIGLTGVDTLEGDPERALETSERGVQTMGNTVGFSVYAYRADALRRLGRLDEAEADLERSIGHHASRLGSWVLLGLTKAARGDEAGTMEVWAHLERHAIGLLSDAARELGVELWPTRDARPDVETAARVLEHALFMMRGNRSSTCATYLTEDGRVRYVPRYPHGGRGPHDADADDLMRARSLLLSATKLSRPRRRRTTDAERPQGGPGHEPTFLTRAQVDEFLERGYLTLRGCFDRELGQRWVADAVERIRTAPQKWIRNYDPAEHDLAGFDPADPATWTSRRFHVDGERRVPIGELSPKLWAAVCDLLGGEHRIATTTMSDYFLLNLNDGAELEDPAPDPGEESWHVDNPSVRSRLDDWRNGLILVVLFSDVEPASGSTFLAEGSWRRVARLMADHPEGVDLFDPENAIRISGECTAFHEITGRIGDAVLIHPLMVHSASANPSGRIRWMANPNVLLEEPLRLTRDDARDHSIVERSIRRAIGWERRDDEVAQPLGSP